MSVVFDFYVSRGNTTSLIVNFLTFSSRQLFRFSVKFFLAELPNKQSMLPELFSQERVFLRKLVLRTPNIRTWAEPLWILSTFVKVVQIAFWVSSETNQGKTVRFSRKKFRTCFQISSHKNCNLRNKSASSYELPRTSPEKPFLAAFFEHIINCIINFQSWGKKFLPPMEAA